MDQVDDEVFFPELDENDLHHDYAYHDETTEYAEHDDYYRPMASHYVQSTRQVVSYSPSKQTNGNPQQGQPTSMYTTPSGFQAFQTVFAPSYESNGDQPKMEPHTDSEQQQLRVLMPVYQSASSSASTIGPFKFVDASGGNSLILSTSNGNYAQNGTLVHHQQQPQQYQTIHVATNPGHGHQLVNGQLLNTSAGQTQFSNQVQYIVVQQAPNGAIPVEIKNENEQMMPGQDGMLRDARRVKDANRKRRRRLTESEEEAMARRQKNLEAKRRRLARETEDEKRRRRQRDAEAKRRRRERETDDQRLQRLARDSARMRRTRRLKKMQMKDGSEMPHSSTQMPVQSQQPGPAHPQSQAQQAQQVQPITRIIHQPKQEPSSYISSSTGAINQTIAAVVDNKQHNMVVVDQKPLQQSAFITSNGHPHTIQIPANSVVQTMAMPSGMITLPSSQGAQHGVQQIILLPPPGQSAGTVAIPAGAQIIQPRHPDSSASSVSSSFISDQMNNSMLPDDPAERQRIRNKERARRRRANETPEQRALRNQKTAERMRRRRAQIAEQKALANGVTQTVKVVLTDEESAVRFDDIFKSVLERADYEVENNGPIVPRAKVPQAFDATTGQPIFVNGSGEAFVIEHVDANGVPESAGTPNGTTFKQSPGSEATEHADHLEDHDIHDSSMSDDGLHHGDHSQSQQMLQSL